jgi:uncharacterized membrane protein
VKGGRLQNNQEREAATTVEEGASGPPPQAPSSDGGAFSLRSTAERGRRWLFSLYSRFPFVSVLPFCAVYVAYWFYLSVDRYYSLHAAVYDLGLEAQSSWVFTQASQWPNAGLYVASIAYSPIHFIFSPLTLLGSYPALLLAQTLGLASGAVAVYEIGRHHLGGRVTPLLLGGAYLLYPPMAGLNWFDLHWEAFFVPLFLFGYLLLQKGRLRTSAVLILVSGLATYPYVIVPGLFGIVVLLESAWPRLVSGQPVDRRRLCYGLFLFGFSAAFFVYQTIYLSDFTLTILLQGAAVTGTIHSGSTTPVNLDNRFWVLLIFLGPVLLLPLFSPKWLVMLAPFAYLVLTSGCWCYSFPDILQLQYSALAIPIVFAGGIEVLGRTPKPPPAVLSKSVSSHKHRLARLHWTLPITSKRVRNQAIPVVILCVTASLALVYQPYGPWNSLAPDPFPVSAVQDVNMTFYDELVHLIDLVPRSTPYFLIQNDMPYALPRILTYQQTPLVSSITDWQNVTAWDAVRNAFPLELYTGEIVQAQVDYLIDNPASSQFLAGVAPGISMYNFVRVAYESGYYGVLGQASGMTLLERNYTGSQQYYVPYSQYFPAAQLFDWQTGQASGTSVIERTNTSDGRIWWGPQTTLSPGTYRATLWLETSNLSAQNSVHLLVTANLGATTLGGQIITGRNFTNIDVWQPFPIVFSINDTYQTVEFPSYGVTWSGTLAIEGVGLTQIAPAANSLS